MNKLNIKWVPILRTTIQASCGVLVALVTNLTKLITDPVWSIVVGAAASIVSCFLMNIQKSITVDGEEVKEVKEEDLELLEDEKNLGDSDGSDIHE